MAQEIEDNYEHYNFVPPTAYVLPRRRRVARCAVSMQPPPQVQSTSGSNLSCTIELCVLRVYTEYAYGAAGSRLEPLSRANRPSAAVARGAEGVRKPKANCREYTVLYQANENSTSP